MYYSFFHFLILIYRLYTTQCLGVSYNDKCLCITDTNDSVTKKIAIGVSIQIISILNNKLRKASLKNNMETPRSY